MKNLPISIKFLGMLGMLAVFVVGAAGFMARQMYVISARAQAVNNTVVLAANNLSEAAGAMEKVRAAMEFVMIAGSEENAIAALQAVGMSMAQFNKDMSEAAAAVPARRAQILDIKQRSNALVSNNSCSQVVSFGSNWTSDGVAATLASFSAGCAPGFVKLTHQMESERNTLNTMAAQELAGLKAKSSHTVLISFIGVISGFVLIALFGYFGIGRWVVRPLDELRGAMDRLARGDFAIRLEDERRDEVGAMARSVRVFLDAAKEKQRLEAVAAEAAQRVEEERARNEAAREAAAAAQALVVESVADGLERLSQGDLLYRLSMSFAPEYEKLRHDFNEAMDTLEKTMKGIATNTHGVSAGAGEITRSSDDLARRTERQAASLEETAAALDEINATVAKTAEGAREARDVVYTAKQDAERSGTVVRETVTAMQEIETSSKQISNIIGVIDEIAFQTNLLALNAGVEAARAGDAGRGFAVVATEVRALAQRSADAAKEIKALISASGTQVEAGVRLVGETGRALARIVEQVNKLSDLIGNIAGSAQEQASGLSEVNSAINQMDQVTQQNAAMVEEATAAAHALSAEAVELSRLVSQFSVGEDEPPPPAAPEVEDVAPARGLPVAPAGKFAALASVGDDGFDEF